MIRTVWSVHGCEYKEAGMCNKKYNELYKTLYDGKVY